MMPNFGKSVCVILCVILLVNLAGAHSISSTGNDFRLETFTDTTKLKKLLFKKKFKIDELKRQNARLAIERQKQRVADSLAQKRAEEKDARIKELAKKAERDLEILTTIKGQSENLSKNTEGLQALNSSLKPPPPPLNFSELIDNRFTPPKVNPEETKDKQEKLRILRKIIKQNSVQVNDSVTVKNQLEIKQIAEVWGFIKSSPIERDYDYNVFNNLIYKSYNLNGKDGSIESTRPLSYETNNARKAGCKITLAVNAGGPLNVNLFLGNKVSRRTFIYSTLNALENKNADGIVLNFGSLSNTQRSNFVQFLSELSAQYRSRQKKYEITITLPAIDTNHGYDLNALDALTDYFLIDFSHFQGQLKGDPIAPLGNQNLYNLTSCVSNYLISKADAHKFILCLPYHGIKWNYSKETGTIESIIPYNTIRKAYLDQTSAFNELTATNFINIKDKAGADVRKLIWYDDHQSLSKKYDLILKMGLGGVAIKYLEEGEGYAELTDELAYKFLQVDTVKQAVVTKKPKRSWWEETKHTLYLYRMGLKYPCDRTYDKLETTLIDRFNLLLAAVCIAVAGFCILKVKKNGMNWQYKKLTIIILLSLVGILIATVFMGLFLDGNVPWFGVEPKAGVDQPCIPMPFHVLFLIITAGIILGILIMRFLIFPLIRKEETP